MSLTPELHFVDRFATHALVPDGFVELALMIAERTGDECPVYQLTGVAGRAVGNLNTLMAPAWLVTLLRFDDAHPETRDRFIDALVDRITPIADALSYVASRPECIDALLTLVRFGWPTTWEYLRTLPYSETLSF